jgi:hypothetical protein
MKTSKKEEELKKIRGTVEHKWTGAFAICDDELIDDDNWVFADGRKIKYNNHD